MSKSELVQAQIAYSKQEELTNVITHAIGTVLGFVGLVFLMLKTLEKTDAGRALGVFAVFLFGLLTALSFALSTLYHALRYGSRLRAIVRKFDRCTVQVLIFAVYAPITLIGMMRGEAADAAWGYALFGVIAVATIVAVVLNAMNVAEVKTFSLIAYVITAWACIIRAGSIIELCGRECFWFLFGGAVIYALGIIFYAVKKIPFNHALWHVCLLGGAALHFVCIYTYML